ncbi:MAG: response regulator [Opitutae bacterium]|nr:response regulator [Opitutae bacterium]MDG1300093.1 response regulator [Opitutae bacterium]
MTIAKQPEERIKILLFENNLADADLVGECLERSNLSFEILAAKSLADGMQALQAQTFDLILLDLSLPDSDGIASLLAVLGITRDEVIIVLAGPDDEELSLKALQEGAQDYLCKDRLSAEALRRSIRSAMARANRLNRLEAQTREVQHNAGLLRRIFDVNSDAMLILTQEYEIKYLNPAAAQLLEADSESLRGEIFPFEIERGKRLELEIAGPDESTRLIELNALDLAWENDSVLLVILRDVTLHRSAELDLQQEMERLAVTLDSIADAVIAVKPNSEIERMNQAAVKLIGMSLESARSQRLGDVLKLRHPLTGKLITDPVSVFIAEEITPELGISLETDDGAEILVSVEMRCILEGDSSHHGCVFVLRDMTSHKNAEKELFRTEKLQSISLLAGGIAHDLNNILTAVVGNISMVRMEMDEADVSSKKLLLAEKAALQATSLTQQLLSFSKGGTPLLESTTIDQLVEDSAQLILRGSNVKCEVHKDDHLWSVDADKGQISQVVNNLIINADQAMPEGGIIRLDLTCERVSSGEIPSLAPGDYVCIAVQDHGGGITPDNLQRIFDPYFTTKQNGNGLGLASSYSIMKSHHGLMTVESVVAAGSTFKVYLPKTAKVAASTPAATLEDNTIYPGHGRILVMDDMEAMMMVAGEILQVLGYEVELSTNGDEAVEAYKKAKEAGRPFDAVVFDLTVPGGMGGEEACRILSEYDPGLIAVASSGYSTSNVMSEYEAAGFKAVVPKPYRIKDMSAALHRILK